MGEELAKITYSRKELAHKYGLSSKTFGKRMKKAGIERVNIRILTPKELGMLVEYMG